MGAARRARLRSRARSRRLPDNLVQRKGAMRVTAAVLYDTKKPVVVEDVELLEPGPHEVQVRWVANGVCHSDLHVITGDYAPPPPGGAGPRSGRRDREGRRGRRDGGTGRSRVLQLHSVVREVLVLHRRPADDVRAPGQAPVVHVRRHVALPKGRTGPPPLPSSSGVRDALGAPGGERHPDPEGRAARRRVPRELRRARRGRTGLQPRQGAARGDRGRVGLRRGRSEHDPGRAPGGRRQDHRRRRDGPEARLGRRVRRDPRRGRVA